MRGLVLEDLRLLFELVGLRLEGLNDQLAALRIQQQCESHEQHRHDKQRRAQQTQLFVGTADEGAGQPEKRVDWQ